jgi:hypothetical protein
VSAVDTVIHQRELVTADHTIFGEESMMSLRPNRSVRIVLVLVTAAVMFALVGFVAAGPAASFTPGASMPEGLSGSNLFYMVLGVLDLAMFVTVYRLARK